MVRNFSGGMGVDAKGAVLLKATGLSSIRLASATVVEVQGEIRAVRIASDAGDLSHQDQSIQTLSIGFFGQVLLNQIALRSLESNAVHPVCLG